MIAPFPWHALPRVSADHVRAVSRVHRAFPVHARTLSRELSTLIGHPVEIDVRRITTGRYNLGDRGDVIALTDGARTLALEIEAELALATASALAGGGMPRIARGRSVDPEVLGATVGVAQWLARSAGLSLSLSDVEPRDCVLIDANVKLGMLRTSVRVAIEIGELDRAPEMSARETLHRLGETPLSLAAVIGAGTARARELADLREGDVVVVDRRIEGLFAGARGVRISRLEPDADGRARVRMEVERLELAAPSPPNDYGSAMTDDTGATMQLAALDGRLEDGLAADLAELPLEVRVELGTATLPAREWAAISSGDTIVLDRRVGDPVSLRIGGKVLARGELVEVDGALGVRITERTS